MKIHTAIILLVIMMSMNRVSYGQISIVPFTHTNVINTDAATIKTLETTKKKILKRNLINAGIIAMLENIRSEEKSLIEKKYGENEEFDKSGAFLMQLLGSTALGFGSHVVSKNLDKGYYMTKNKRELIKKIGLDKKMLFTLLSINDEKVTAANRQEIYRLRSEIIRQYSQNDKVVLALLLLPATAYAMENRMKLLRVIKNLKIVL